MASLTAERKTLRYLGDSIKITAGAAIHGGGLVATNAAGKAVAATPTGRIVIGVAVHSAGEGEDLAVYRVGVFGFDNASGDDAITAADIGAPCYVADDHTVSKTASKTPSGGSATPQTQAGIIYGLDGDTVLVKL